MPIYSIPSFISFFLLLIPSYYTLKNWKGTYIIRLLGVLLVELYLYVICEFFLINTQTMENALFWDKMIYLPILFIPATYLHIALYYPKKSNVLVNKDHIVFLIYLPAIFFSSLLPEKYLIAGIQPEYWGYGKIEGPAYDLFRIYLILYFVGGLYVMVQKYRHTKDPRLRNMMGFLGISFITPILLATIITVILQPMGINYLNIMATVISFNYFSFTLTYAIVRHRLFDLQLLLTPIVKTRKYHFHQSIRQLIKEIPDVLSYEKIVESLARLFACDVALNVNGKMVAAEGGSKAFRDFHMDNEYDLLEKKDRQFECQNIYLAHELKGTHERFYNTLKQNNIEVLIPLRSEKKLIGILKFGEGSSRNIYSTQDFNLITNLYEKLIIAIKHISIMEERLKVKEKQLKILKQRIRTFKSESFRGYSPASESIDHFSNDDNRSRFERINAHFFGKDAELENLIRSHRPEKLKIEDNHSDNPDICIIDGRIFYKATAFISKINKPFLMITDQQNVRKKAGEFFPNLLKAFIHPMEINTDLLHACRSLFSVHQAVLYDGNNQKLISINPHITKRLSEIRAAASKAGCILITGETGTGKELLASYISHLSQNDIIIPVNCAAIPEMLFESEFFGHAKGAFTGAVHKHKGLLEKADGGFLFLDEIGELPLNLQAKFLRILEGSSFEMVGGNKFIKPHVRFITSTNQDLENMVKRGQFRSDLFFRLNPVHFHLPPLQARKEDIILLAHYFLWKYNAQYGKDCRISQSYLYRLQQHPWTGHVRELSNMIHQDVLAAREGSIIKRSVYRKNRDNVPPNFAERVQQYEKKLIIEALSHCGSQRAAASHLNLPISTLHSKIKKYGLQDS